MKRILSYLSIVLLSASVACSDSSEMDKAYNSVITPGFTFGEEEIIAGITPVTFTNTTTAEGTTVSEYFWHFGFAGEGNWSEEAAPDPIVYNRPGDYTVTLTAWGADGNRATTTRTITVLADNVLPTADFSYSPQMISIGTTVTFTDKSTDSDGEIVSREWLFPDGTTSTDINATYTFEQMGMFNVQLTVTDDRRRLEQHLQGHQRPRRRRQRLHAALVHCGSLRRCALRGERRGRERHGLYLFGIGRRQNGRAQHRRRQGMGIRRHGKRRRIPQERNLLSFGGHRRHGLLGGARIRRLLVGIARLCVRRRDGFGALEEHDGLRPGGAHRLLDALHQSEHGHRRQPRHQRRDPRIREGHRQEHRYGHPGQRRRHLRHDRAQERRGDLHQHRPVRLRHHGSRRIVRLVAGSDLRHVRLPTRFSRPAAASPASMPTTASTFPASPKDRALGTSRASTARTSPHRRRRPRNGA